MLFQEVGSRTYTDLKKSTQWGEKKKYVHNPKLSNLLTCMFHANKRIFYVSCEIKHIFMTFIFVKEEKVVSALFDSMIELFTASNI